MGIDQPRSNYPEVDSGYDPIPYADLQASGRWPREFQIPADWIPVLASLTAKGPATPKMLVCTPDGHLIVHPDEQPSITINNTEVEPLYVCAVCASPVQPISTPNPIQAQPSPIPGAPLVTDWIPLTSSGLNFVYDFPVNGGTSSAISVDVAGDPPTNTSNGVFTVQLKIICVSTATQKVVQQGDITLSAGAGEITLTYGVNAAPVNAQAPFGACSVLKLGIVTPVNYMKYRLNATVA